MSSSRSQRRNALPSFTAYIALLLLLSVSASAAGSVLGLDFGTLHLKAALIKPGIPLEIVPTKDSKRKETAAVAFKPTRDSQNNVVAETGSFPERAYGGDALALQGRMPGEVFPNLKTLLGLSASGTTEQMVAAYLQRNPNVQASQLPENGTTVFTSSAFSSDDLPWTVEELLAMQLANVRQNAEALAGKGTSISDTVVTVPGFYTADERRSVMTAVTLAGLEVNAMISDGLAVGVDYAKSRTFPEITKDQKPEYHIVYDMGAGSTTATVLRFQSRSVKDIGRFNKTVQEVAAVGIGWDRTLGGDSLTAILLDDYLEKLIAQPAMKSKGTTAEEVKRNGRAMSRIWKDAEKARQVLSANTETTSFFEELLPDVDFRTKLTRSDFEALTVEYANRVAGPISDALKSAKIDMAQVDSIILHGGTTRTPFVQKKLEKLAGGTGKLRSNVNADESAVFGAAFKAAGLSPSFKVKEIRDSDVPGYAVGISYRDGQKQRRQTMFPATSPVGSGASTKHVTFKDKDDFEFEFFQTVGDVDQPILKIKTDNLTESVNKLIDKFGCTKDDMTTKLSARLSPIDGLPEVLSGSVSCEVDGSGKGESLGDSVKDFFGFGKKKDQEPLTDDENERPAEDVDAASSATSSSSAKPSAASSSANASSSETPKPPQKRTESIRIAISAVKLGNPQPDPAEITRMRGRLRAYDLSDKARYARDEAMNGLESYIYFVRDFLTNEEYQEFATDADRSGIRQALDIAQTFMEDAGEVTKAKKQDFQSRVGDLKKLVEPIQRRRQEQQGRPEAVEKLKKSLGEMKKVVDLVEEQNKLAEEKQKASDTPEPSTATPESPPPAAEAPAGDAPDPPPNASADADAASESAKPPHFNPYADVDLTGLKDMYAKAVAWLEDKEAAQATVRPDQDPALLIQDVERKANDLATVMLEKVYRNLRTPPKAPKSAKTFKSKTAKTSKGDASSATPAAAEDPGTSSAESVEPSAATQSHVIDEL